MQSIEKRAVKAGSIRPAMQVRIADLITEINQFWVEVTGSGLPESEVSKLESMHPEDLLHKLNGLKMSDASQYLVD